MLVATWGLLVAHSSKRRDASWRRAEVASCRFWKVCVTLCCLFCMLELYGGLCVHCCARLICMVDL